MKFKTDFAPKKETETTPSVKEEKEEVRIEMPVATPMVTPPSAPLKTKMHVAPPPGVQGNVRKGMPPLRIDV